MRDDAGEACRVDTRSGEVQGTGLAADDYYEGLNHQLLEAIPPSSKVLELGCGAGRLGEQYKALNPSVIWNGVDIHGPALKLAAARLDRVWQADLDSVRLEKFGDDYDCVVAGDVLEHIKEPERLLLQLREITVPWAHLVLCIPNMSHISVIERLLLGDLCYDDQGLLDRTHLRFFSRGSLFKLLLDCGWLPDLKDRILARHMNGDLAVRLVDSAVELGASPETAKGILFTFQMIVDCVRSEQSVSSASATVSTIVPVNNELQLSLNVARSPGLVEIGSELVTYEGATSAADAFDWARVRASGEWLLYCHQDVYLPAGSGRLLVDILDKIPRAERPRTLIGFVGFGTESLEDPFRHAFASGLVIDRTRRLDWPATDVAVSIDELAIVAHRDNPIRIDPSLGWHAWATDLCLAGIVATPPRYTRIVRVPIFHNSLSNNEVSQDFRESGAKVVAKYPQFRGIKSLCGRLG